MTWHEVTDETNYTSPYPQHEEWRARYNLTNTRVFVLDMLQDWVERIKDKDPDKADQFLQFKLELIDELEHAYKLKGAL